jgi:AraC-like DNA-binding protein
VKLAVSLGSPKEDILRRAEIAHETLLSQDERIPLPRYIALYRAAAALTRQPTLALRFGAGMDFNDVSIVGLVCEAAETMSDAIRQLNRYVRLVVDVETEAADRFAIRRMNGAAWFVDTRKNPNEFFELTETALAQFASGMYEMGGVAPIKAAHFTHDAPPYAEEYERIFRVPLTFRSNRNAVQFDPDYLDRQVAVLPRYVFAVLSAHADELLKSLEDRETMKGRVEAVLAPTLPTGRARIADVANALGLSSRSLQRRLLVEGTSFEDVLDGLRHRLSLHYLSGGTASVSEVAYLVGFSDPAAFSRAFKRWTGRAPREARKPT